jgi:hypothetical protein
MISFFRKIRQDLLANSQFFKYLKYAIGEIVLVVLGILIALYINNWNEEKKVRVKFDEVLIDVEQELEHNISYLKNNVTPQMVYYDSILLKLFVDSLKFDNNDVYKSILKQTSYKVPIQDDSFKELNKINHSTHQQKTILQELKKLNKEGRNYLDDWGDFMIEEQINDQKVIENYDWFNNYIFNRLEDDRITEFFANDPKYLKMVARKFENLTFYRFHLTRYEYEAIEVYTKIYKYLDSLKINHSDSLLFQYNTKDYKHYLGKYEPKWSSIKEDASSDSVVISIEKDNLMLTFYADGIDNKFEINPINKYHFRDERTLPIYYLEFNKQGEVEGLRLSVGHILTSSMKKIR